VSGQEGCHESRVKLKFENCFDFEGVNLGLSVSKSDDGIESLKRRESLREGWC
jgi:hypothetical protein